MPLAIEQLDLSGYDLILSSSHAVAKGVLSSPDQLHLCMCYTPIRYAWDLQHQYLQASGLVRGPKSWAARWLLHKMRLWDVRTAHGVDQFIAISHYIARRIHKTYRRDSVVIYPPVDTDFFVPPPASAAATRPAGGRSAAVSSRATSPTRGWPCSSATIPPAWACAGCGSV
jgi:glycosyltransferase involved in cell wall biosynthesis